MDKESGAGKNGEKKYEVRDKRMFTQDGDLKNESFAGSEKPLPRLDFISFTMSLATAALFHLGEVCNEAGKPEGKNIPLARQTIEIIEMLQEKTKGNLTREESKILDDILFDLRMRFVAKTK